MSNNEADKELADLTEGLNEKLGKMSFESIANKEIITKIEKQREQQQIDFTKALDKAEKRRQEIREQEASANIEEQDNLYEILEELVINYDLQGFKDYINSIKNILQGQTITDDDKKSIITSLREQIDDIENPNSNITAIEKYYKLIKLYALIKKMQSPNKRTFNEMRKGYSTVGGKTKKNKKLKRKSNKNKLKKNLKKKTKKVKKIKKTKSKK